MANTNDALTELEVKNQLLLERLKRGIERDTIDELIDSLSRVLLSNLAARSPSGALQIERAVARIKEQLDQAYDEYIDNIIKSELTPLAISQEKFERAALEDAIGASTLAESGIVLAAATTEKLVNAIATNPMSARGAEGKLLLEYLEKWKTDDVEKIAGKVRNGFFTGQTNQQIAQQIVGEVGNNALEGEDMKSVRKNAKTIVRTSVQHVANVARNDALKSSGVTDEYEWVSVLDGRTSDQCRALDGQTFEYDKGPLPPIHPNCRSTTVGVVKPEFVKTTVNTKKPAKGADGFERISTQTQYYTWLKTQPSVFQDAILGVKRGKLFRNGGLSPTRFAELQLDKNFLPITLAEMEELVPSAFAKANI